MRGKTFRGRIVELAMHYASMRPPQNAGENFRKHFAGNAETVQLQ